MAIQTAIQRNTVAQAYADAADFAALYTTVPGGTAGTEVTGGAPAYARQPLTWGAPANGVTTATAVVFDVPASTTIAGAGVHSLATGGDYLDGGAVTSQTFASQGTYTLTLTYTQT